MAKKKALTIYDGKIGQLKDTDFIGEVNLATTINPSLATIVAGSPLYQTTTASESLKAQANAVATSKVNGFFVADVLTTASGSVQDSGTLVLTTAQWDAITGQTGGLTAGSEYFLDPATAGKMTTTAPTTSGQFVQSLGVASSTTDFHIVLGEVYSL